MEWICSSGQVLNNFQNYIITNYYQFTKPLSDGDIDMDRQPVQSCNLKSVGYDNNLKNLEIEFHSGLIYQYQNVPSHIFASLLSAPSTGTFFTDKIKNRYRSKRLDKITLQ
jgi:KTSC domain